MKAYKIAATAILAAYAPLSAAGVGHRTATVAAVQMESAERAGYEGIVWVRHVGDGPWAGGPDCPAVWGYYNGKTNPQFTASALASRLTEKPLRMYVSDSLPKLDGWCQIFNMEF